MPLHAWRRSVRGATAAFLVLVLAPSAVPAQWLEEPGRGWVDLSVYHQDTGEVYGSDGVVRSFFAGGRAVSTSIFLTVAGGLAPHLDAWVQVPYHRLRYDDVQADRRRTGIGDTRLYLRTAPLALFGVDAPLALRAGVKLPVSDFEVDTEVIPLGDGQRDWEILVEVGHSFHPLPAYVSGWVGYRWRQANDETFQQFGDEVFFLAKGGASRGRWSLELIAEGERTVTQPSVAGLPFSNLRRRLLTLTPNLGLAVGPGTAKIGARFSVSGANLPAGTALTAGYFTGWSF